MVMGGGGAGETTTIHSLSQRTTAKAEDTYSNSITCNLLPECRTAFALAGLMLFYHKQTNSNLLNSIGTTYNGSGD